MMPAVVMATRVNVRFISSYTLHSWPRLAKMHNMPKRASSRRNVIAVIDIGSNSGRVVVFEHDTAGHLRPLAGSRASLRLVHDVDSRGELSDATMGRAMEAIRDFKAIATGAGARRIVAVA